MKKAGSLPFFLVTGALLALVALSAAEAWRHEARPLYFIALAYFSYEVGVQGLLVAAAGLGLRRRWAQGSAPPGGELPTLTVLIAAHNERSCISETLKSVFAQGGVEARVIVASDGSHDGMNALLVERYGLAPAAGGGRHESPRLLLLALPKVGKGAALNAALAEAEGEIVVTLDADTRLAPGALAALAGAFRDPRTVAAGGFIYVRNVPEGGWLARYQYWEYLKNFIWRIGLVHLNVCLQVSGAFGAFRTRTLRELGGFSGRSLVEDYEIIFRLHERMRRAGAEYRVEVVPEAVAYTEAPDTVASFVHQRTRWFAGFLQTLWEYRRLVGDRRLGALGWFMLPIKCVDAILPLWGSLSLALLLGAALGGAAHWRWAALELFALRWGIELGWSGLLCAWHRRLAGGRKGALAGPRLAWHIATEAVVFNWFRQIAVLNAYGWFLRRVQRWHQPRWQADTKPA